MTPDQTEDLAREVFAKWAAEEELADICHIHTGSMTRNGGMSGNYLSACVSFKLPMEEGTAWTHLKSLQTRFDLMTKGNKWDVRAYPVPILKTPSAKERQDMVHIETWMKQYCKRHRRSCFRNGERVLWLHEVTQKESWGDAFQIQVSFCVEYSYDEGTGSRFANRALDEFALAHPEKAKKLSVSCFRYR